MTPPPDACWNLTPVSTFTTGIFDQGAVWYDNISDTFLISSWGGNSIYRVNPQMTPLAVITDTYRQMGCRPLRPDGLIYTTRGQPAGGDIFVYNAALTPVATIQITTYAQPISWDENGDGYIPTGFSMLKVNSSLTPVATVNFTNNVLGIIPQAANDKIYVAVYNTGISILNIQLTPQATIASVPAGFQQINVSPDGHIMQTSRSDNWFRVFKPYPDLSLEMQYSLTDPRGFDLRNNDLFMFDTLYFKDYPACATPTFTPTVTPTRTPAVVSVPLEIQNVVPFPHPYNPASASGLSINYFLTRHCNSVKINIYTCAFRQILDETAGNNLASGQKAYTVPADRLALLSNGAYYFYLEGEDAGVTKRSKLQPLIVLRR